MKDGARCFMNSYIYFLISQKVTEWNQMLEVTEQPDYDLEAYVNSYEYLVQSSTRMLITMGETVNSLRLAMQVEEQASKQINKRRPQ